MLKKNTSVCNIAKNNNKPNITIAISEDHFGIPQELSLPKNFSTIIKSFTSIKLKSSAALYPPQCVKQINAICPSL